MYMTNILIKIESAYLQMQILQYYQLSSLETLCLPSPPLWFKSLPILTVTLKTHVPLFPAWSHATYVTSWVPRPNRCPGVWVGTVGADYIYVIPRCWQLPIHWNRRLVSHQVPNLIGRAVGKHRRYFVCGRESSRLGISLTDQSDLSKFANHRESMILCMRIISEEYDVD